MLDTKVTVGTFSDPGTRDSNADVAWHQHVPHLDRFAFGVFDGIGGGEEVEAATYDTCHTAVRSAARRGVLVGMLNAAAGIDGDVHQGYGPPVNMVGILAVLYSDFQMRVAHVGDCAAYVLGGVTPNGVPAFNKITEDHTEGQYQRNRGIDEEQAAETDHIVRNTVARATASTVTITDIPAELNARIVVLCSDGVHKALAAHELERLVLEHQNHHPSALAAILVKEAVKLAREETTEPDAYRDNATALVIRMDRSS